MKVENRRKQDIVLKFKWKDHNAWDERKLMPNESAFLPDDVDKLLVE